MSFGNETFAYVVFKIVQNIYHIVTPEDKTWEQAYTNFRILDDVYKWNFAHWFVRPFSFIYEPLEKFILESHQHGILDYLKKKYFPLTKNLEVEGPKVLTFEMLSAGFYLWMTCVLISIIIFVLELVTFHLAKRTKNQNIVQNINAE